MTKPKKRTSKRKRKPAPKRVRVKGLVRQLGKQEFARLLGVTPGTVSRWVRQGAPSTRWASVEQVKQGLPVHKARQAVDAVLHAAAEVRAYKWLVEQGREPAAKLRKAKAELVKNKRRLRRLPQAEQTLLQDLRKLRTRSDSLDPTLAASLATRYKIDVRSIYTVFHYL